MKVFDSQRSKITTTKTIHDLKKAKVYTQSQLTNKNVLKWAESLQHYSCLSRACLFLKKSIGKY